MVKVALVIVAAVVVVVIVVVVVVVVVFVVVVVILLSICEIKTHIYTYSCIIYNHFVKNKGL